MNNNNFMYHLRQWQEIRWYQTWHRRDETMIFLISLRLSFMFTVLRSHVTHVIFDTNEDSSESQFHYYLCRGRRCWVVELCWRSFCFVPLRRVPAVVSAPRRSSVRAVPVPSTQQPSLYVSWIQPTITTLPKRIVRYLFYAMSLDRLWISFNISTWLCVQSIF